MNFSKLDTAAIPLHGTSPNRILCCGCRGETYLVIKHPHSFDPLPLLDPNVKLN